MEDHEAGPAALEDAGVEGLVDEVEHLVGCRSVGGGGEGVGLVVDAAVVEEALVGLVALSAQAEADQGGCGSPRAASGTAIGEPRHSRAQRSKLIVTGARVRPRCLV